jgi:hypothetical protein
MASRVVIDTVSQAITPGDADRSVDTSIFTKAMQRICAATGANVTAICHPTKKGEGTRGSGAWEANVDTTLFYSWDKAKKIGRIKSGTKFRIGDPAKIDFMYQLECVDVGVDDDGDPIPVILSVSPRCALDTVAVGDAEMAKAGLAATEDNLTPDQNYAVEVKRAALCEQIATWLRTKPDAAAWITDARLAIPEIAKLYKTSGSKNFTRDFHRTRLAIERPKLARV